MPLPSFNHNGDLPVGLWQATIEELVARFGGPLDKCQAVTDRLLRICELARATGKLERFIIFGSYITAKPEPNDVDVVLVMRDDFDCNSCDNEMRTLFQHEQAAAKFDASIFWIRPSLLILDTLEEFIDHWQIKRDGTRRGIVEVIE